MTDVGFAAGARAVSAVNLAARKHPAKPWSRARKDPWCSSFGHGRVARRVRDEVLHAELAVQVGFAPAQCQGNCAAVKEHRGARGYLPPRGHRVLMYLNSLLIQPEIAVSQSTSLPWLLLCRWLYKLASLGFPQAHARLRSCTNPSRMLRLRKVPGMKVQRRLRVRG